MSADGSIIIDTDIDDKNAQQKLNRINKKIQSLENQLASKNHGKLPLEENLNSVNTKLQEAKTDFYAERGTKRHQCRYVTWSITR